MSQHQPIPVVTDADVERITRRDYPSAVDEVTALLAQYGTEKWHNEVPRVRVAVLRLGAGNIDTLKKHLGYALSDYRDALMGAEYMKFATLTLMEPQPSEGAAETAINQDWEDYATWFRR